MLTVRRGEYEFRVGTLKRQGSELVGLVVLDSRSKIALAEPGYTALYEHAEGCIGSFRTEVVLNLIGSPDQFPRSEIEQAVDAYCQTLEVNPEAEWLITQQKEAGLLVEVCTYAKLRERYAGDKEPTYEELLSTPEWLRRRAEILTRDCRQCVKCKATPNNAIGYRLILDVHHRYYVRGMPPWEYPDEALLTLCRECHKQLHKTEWVPVYDLKDGKLVKTKLMPCIRCLGSGFFPQYIHIESGICFKCHGARFEAVVSEVKPSTQIDSCLHPTLAPRLSDNNEM